MDDSSEDDRPIGTRDIVKAATRLLEDDDSDVTGSPVPEWISQHTPVEKSRPEAESSSDSDEVVDLISQDPKDALHEDKTGFSGPLADNAKRKPSPPAALNKTKNSKGTKLHKADSICFALSNFECTVQSRSKLHQSHMHCVICFGLWGLHVVLISPAHYRTCSSEERQQRKSCQASYSASCWTLPSNNASPSYPRSCCHWWHHSNCDA